MPVKVTSEDVRKAVAEVETELAKLTDSQLLDETIIQAMKDEMLNKTVLEGKVMEPILARLEKLRDSLKAEGR